jgi:heterodisulfide reductase subunit A-like polyferredoxin
MQRTIVFITVLLTALYASAQRKIVVVDMETHIPIAGVSVKTDSAHAVMTDINGIANIAERFDSISFNHMKYLSDKVTFEEMKDTMYLVPKNLMLPDVVVTGVNPDLKKAMKKNYERMLEQPTVKGLTFDFANIIDRRGRRDRKHYKKAKEILREWDAK